MEHFMHNPTHITLPSGETITLLPLAVNRDSVSGNFYAYDGNSGRKIPISELEQMANDGEPSAQCAMGDYYTAEFDNPAYNNIDYQKAFEWYKKSAMQNHPKALWSMGNFYALGVRVVEKDFAKSTALLEESAKLGFLDAMLHLGQVYMMNDVYDKAIYWLEKADTLRHPDASEHLENARLLSNVLSMNPVLKEKFDKQNEEYWGRQTKDINQNIIKFLVSRHGEEVLRDTSRLLAFIADYLEGENEPLLKKLKWAIIEDVPRDMLALKNTDENTRSLRILAISNSLDKAGMKSELALKVVGYFADALGFKAPQASLR